MRDEDPDPWVNLPALSVAEDRLVRHFDGNAQRHVRLWLWADTKLFRESDYMGLLINEALDWVIVPMASY